jgi:hypothetical protein
LPHFLSRVHATSFDVRLTRFDGLMHVDGVLQILPGGIFGQLLEQTLRLFLDGRVHRYRVGNVRRKRNNRRDIHRVCSLEMRCSRDEKRLEVGVERKLEKHCSRLQADADARATDAARSGVMSNRALPSASRINTSRASLDRLLDPEEKGVTLHTLERAAVALGKRLEIRLT